MKNEKLELTDNEIIYESSNKKRVIPLSDIREVRYKEPGRLTGGLLDIIPFYDDLLRITITKKGKENAQKIYTYLKYISENNSPPIKQLEQDPSLKEFKCLLQEERERITTEKTTDTQDALVTIFDDKIIIKKIGMFSKMSKGSKTVLFQDVTSIDLDLGITYNYIVLTMAGSPGIILQQYDKRQIQKFYDLLHYKFQTFKTNMINNSNPVHVTSTVSDTDELLKWHELKEKGVITEEEFEAKKKQILGL
ncbi:MAG: SHOCT domain-containing protein [Methanosphaera stadtmanae]|nr:SHOCT domain-containing protein [Methanosphaera stadtmanae]